MRLLALSAVFSVITLFVHAQVTVNEGMNRNFSILADEDGEYGDWVELYNAGTSAVIC